MLKIGRYEKDQLDIEEYHADPSSVSRTKIMLYDDCPRKYQAMYLTNEMSKEVTKPMILGSAFHTLILEPEYFDDRFGVLPVGADRRTTQIKQLVDAMKADGKLILDSDTFHAIKCMEMSLKNHAEASALVFEGNPVYERSYIYGDDDSGITVKARPDIIRNNCFVDLKTCRQADEFSFGQSMLRGGNHIQGAMFQDAMRVVDNLEAALNFPVVNVAIETTEPYCIAIYFISQDAIQAGRQRYKHTLKRMAASLISGHFPSYETKEINLPGWYTAMDEND